MGRDVSDGYVPWDSEDEPLPNENRPVRRFMAGRDYVVIEDMTFEDADARPRESWWD